MNKGFDANRDLSPFGACLINEEFNFVGRYYNINNPSKNLTFSEANYLSSIGLKIVAIWENGFPTNSSYFSYQKGIADGTAAYEYATNTIKQPSFTPIYFAVDYDASQGDIDGVISEYFKGIIESFNLISDENSIYIIGVYGSGLVCKTLLDTKKVGYTWLAQSKGWRGYNSFHDYNIKQLDEKTECADLNPIAGDLNESPDQKEGSFQVLHLVDYIIKKNLLNKIQLNKIQELSDLKSLTAGLTLAQIRVKVKKYNNSTFSDELIIAICWTESSFIPTAKNPASSATGLMMMTTGAIDTVNANTPAGTHFEHSEMKDADKAIAAGTWYLKIIFEHSGGRDKKKTLKQYGDGTDSYVEKIIKCETCMKTSDESDQQTCLNEIHSFQVNN
jgi:hypothetical protein